MTSLAEQFLDDVGSSDDSDQDPDNQRPQKLKYGSEQQHQSDPTDSAAHQSAELFDVALLHRLNALQSRISASYERERSESDKHEDISNGEYALVTDCAVAIADVDEAIVSLHQSLLSAYSPAFPELETLILNPMDYARVARLAAEHTDLSAVDFRPILPSASVITVQVTASSSAGRPLSKSERLRVCAIADAMTTFDERREELLEHIVRRANNTAPNLVALVGGVVAAKLIAYAGGLRSLAEMPSGNVKVLGKAKKALVGTSSRTTRLHDGVIQTCPIVNGLPPKMRPKAGSVVAGKACLAARVDACRESTDGAMGAALHDTLVAKFAKMQERPPARTAKPLPIPGDETKRRHRGGARARKEKERLGLTEARKLANRLKFGEPELIKGNDLENEGFGMLGASDSHRLKIHSKKTDSVSVAAKRKLEKQKKREGQSEADRLGITSNILLVSKDSAPESKTNTSAAEEPVGRGMSVLQETKSKYFTPLTPFLGVGRSDREIQKTSKNAS